MTKKAKIKEKTNWSDKIVTGAAIIGAIIFGRLFGFAGIGAAVAGWFVYKKVKTNNFFLGIIAGIISGIVAYFVLALVLVSLIAQI